MPRGRNRCWAWLVVLSGCVVSMIVDGINFSFGMLFIELLPAFEKGKSDTAWIGSIMICARHVFGPLAAVAVSRYGCRRVAVAGSIVSFIGISSSFFCTELYQLYITFGCLGGFGFCFMHLAATVAVVQCFDKRRVMAVGIASCGSGLGAIIFNPLTNALIETYGWRGTLLIEGAVALNGVLCGLTFRPSKKSLKDLTIQNGEESSEKGGVQMEDLKRQSIATDNQFTAGRMNRLIEHGNMRCMNSMVDSDTNDTEITNSCCDTAKDVILVDNTCIADDKEKHDSEHYDSDVSKIEDALMPTVSFDRSGNEVEIDLEEQDEKFTRKDVVGLRKIFPFHLLRDPRCVIFLLSSSFHSLAFAIPFNLLPDWAIERGFSPLHAVYLVTALGVSNTASRALVGWLVDKPCIPRVMVYKGLVLTVGLVTMLSPLCSTYWLLMIYACVFGALIGSFITLCPVVLADMFGVDLIAETMGINYFVIGIAALVSTPIGGWIFDVTGSYDISFIVAGSEFFLAGLVLLCPDIVKRSLAKEK